MKFLIALTVSMMALASVNGLYYDYDMPMPNTPYVPVGGRECGDKTGPWPAKNGLEDAGFISHNDYLADGETGPVYHHYSFNNPALASPVVTYMNNVLQVSGSAFGGFPASETFFVLTCSNVTGGPYPAPITGNQCSGSYLHSNTSTVIQFAGKANGDGHEVLVHLDGDGNYIAQVWYTFTPAFDAEGISTGDFVFFLGCSDPDGPFCGDGAVNAEDETCEPSLDDDCRDDCTKCGDGNVDPGEQCDDVEDDSCTNCQIVTVPDAPAPFCVEPFNPEALSTANVFTAVDGNADGGVYARNSLWYDWAPRSFVEPSVVAINENNVQLWGYLDNDGELCEINYNCEDVETVNAELLTGKDCFGTLTCGSESVALRGKSQADGESELDCISKWGSAFRCIGWIEWDLEEGSAHGDLVFTPVCDVILI